MTDGTTQDVDVAEDSGKKERRPTWYVILELLDPTDAPDTWHYETKVRAFSQNEAIKNHLGTEIPEGRTFVAVPESSWQPKTPTVKVQKRLVFDD